MASIRRKKHKWQAVIRRAGQPTISKSFISKTDARKWALVLCVLVTVSKLYFKELN